MSQRENPIAQAPIKKWEIKLLVLTVVLVILGCIALNQLVLGGTPHGWDGVSYYYQAKVFASGRIVAPSTRFIEFFWIANIINRTDKRFSKYTPGWPLILTPAMFLGIPFIANAALAGLCVALMWLLTRDLFGIREAWVSVALAATSPFFIFMGANYLSHMSSATALLGMLYALIKAVKSPQKQQSVYWAIMAGICALTAVLIRPYSGLLGGVSVIWITGWLVSWQPKRWVRVIVVMCVIGLVGVAGLIMYNKATTGAPFLMGYKYYSKDLSFLGVEGVFRNSVWENLHVNIPKFFFGLNREIWGWFLPDLSLLLVLVIVRVRDRKVWAFIGAIVIFVVGHSFYYFFDLYYGPRLAFETLPWIIIAASVGTISLWDVANKFGKRKLIQVILICLLCSNTVYGATGLFAKLTRYYSANYCGQGIELLRITKEKNLKNAVVFLRTTGAYGYANLFPLNTIDLRSSNVLYARYSARRIKQMIAAFPREEYWILDVEYKEITQRNEYADRFEIINLKWTRL